MSEPTFDQRTQTAEEAYAEANANYRAATGQDLPQSAPAPDGTPAPAPEPVHPGFDYYVHLADGSVERVMESPVGTRFTKDDGTSVQIIGVYPR